MKHLIPIDTLRCQCGHSYSYDPENINNGYNCDAPDIEEYETHDNKKIGKCYTWSCPVAYHADLKDMKELDPVLYAEYKDEADSEGYIDNSDWMVLTAYNIHSIIMQ